jgi:hypothetical protein
VGLGPPGRNPRARASLLVGAASALALPAGIALSWYSPAVTLLEGIGAAGLSLLLGWAALVLARRSEETLALTLGRAGGRVAARWGRLLGLAGICASLTAAMAVAFYGLLTLFAS